MVRVAGEIGGVQAQLPSAAQIALWARVRDVRIEGVETALWKDRTLARAWCMRRTVHLVPSEELAMFVRGSARRAEKEIRWSRGKGVPERTLEGLLRAVLQALDRPATPSEIAERVGHALGLRVRATRGGGWGSRRQVACVQVGRIAFPAGYLLHMVGARGVVCSGPSRAGESTFVRGDAWLPDWHDTAAERAERDLLRRYLTAYGPATPSDFAGWSGMGLTEARSLWTESEAVLAPVRVGGRSSWVLRRDLGELEGAEFGAPTISLLPYFDSFLLGHEERDHLVRDRHRGRVYRAQGWIYPVVLVDGRVSAVWSYSVKSGQLLVDVAPFLRLPAPVVKAVRRESDDLGDFLGCRSAVVRFGRPS